jgi:hypothetical protein
MNQEQFGQFWEQLKSPLKVKWEKITAEDLDEIQGDLTRFCSVIFISMHLFSSPEAATASSGYDVDQHHGHRLCRGNTVSCTKRQWPPGPTADILIGPETMPVTKMLSR